MNEEHQLIYNKLMSKYNFDEKQEEEINIGLNDNLNVSVYATPEFNWKQMKQIRYGLESNIDVSIYAKTEFNESQM